MVVDEKRSLFHDYGSRGAEATCDNCIAVSVNAEVFLKFQLLKSVLSTYDMLSDISTHGRCCVSRSQKL